MDNFLLLGLGLLGVALALGLAYMYTRRRPKTGRAAPSVLSEEAQAKKEAKAAKKVAKKEAEVAQKVADRAAQKAADKAADKTPWDDYVVDDEAYGETEYGQLSDGQDARAEEQARTRSKETSPPARSSPLDDDEDDEGVEEAGVSIDDVLASPEPLPSPKPQASVPPPAPAAMPAPIPAPGGLALPGMARLYDQWQTPDFSSFYPPRIEAEKTYAFLVYVHIKDALAQIQEEAQKFVALMGGEMAAGRAKSQAPIPRGTVLTFIPQAEGLHFSPDSQTLMWGEGPMVKPFQSANFLFSVPASASGEITGRVLVMDGLNVVGSIPFQMTVAQVAGAPMQQQSGLKALDPVFASYSHKDSPIMEYFRARRAEMGQKMLVDIYDLRAGEHWSSRLMEMIDESAVFQLFWSEHSANSPYCRQEWDHALRLLRKRPRFIQPIWWDSPMPPPPPELAALHFQKIDLPLILRLSKAARGLIRWPVG